MIITSVQNPRVVEIAKLRRGRASADAPVLIDGRREIQRALAAGWSLQTVFHCPAMLSDDDRRWLAGAGLHERALTEVNAPVMERIAYGDRTDGLVALAARPHRDLKSLKVGPAPLIAVMHGIEKPGNLGGILRSADAAGVEAVIASDPRTDVYNSSVIRASTGAVFSMQLTEGTSADAAAFLRSRNVRMFATRPDAKVEYTACDFRGPTAFILGAEAEGLGAAWQGDDIQPVRITMQGVCDSLNVSVTAAILFFEARRQRSQS